MAAISLERLLGEKISRYGHIQFMMIAIGHEVQICDR